MLFVASIFLGDLIYFLEKKEMKFGNSNNIRKVHRINMIFIVDFCMIIFK